MQPYILALDQGTTSSRAIVFDRHGRILGMAQQEFQQYFPQPGWIEHDAGEIWRSQLSVARRVLHENGILASDIAAIGISNQRETTVLWDRVSGEPIGPAIVWQDRRTAEACDRLRSDGHAALFQNKTGLVLDAYFSGTKIAWLLEHVPGALERAHRGELAFGTIDSWLIYKLCGSHVTDPGNASRTLLFNIHSQSWDAELLELLSVPPEVLAQVVPSSGIAGYCDRSLFGAAIPIAGIAGDQQAATFGQACFQPGMAKNTYGTGCFMLMNTGKQAVGSRNCLLSTIGWKLGPHASTSYMLEGSVFMAGATIQWLRDGLNIIERSSDAEALAAGVSDSGGVFLVPAFTGLGTPYWDAYARGTLLGMTRGTTKAHIARAALDAIAFQSADVLEAMNNDAEIELVELRVDGGASRNNLLMQIQADILGVPVVRPRITETTALGAAFLAGLAVGFWRSEEEIRELWEEERRFYPAISHEQRGDMMHHWKRAVDRSRKWIEPGE